MSALERVKRGKMTSTMCDVKSCYRTGQWNVFIVGMPAGSYCDAHAREWQELFANGGHVAGTPNAVTYCEASDERRLSG